MGSREQRRAPRRRGWRVIAMRINPDTQRERGRETWRGERESILVKHEERTGNPED